MPQYRQNFITKEWVVIAPERAKRPDQFARKEESKVKLQHDPKCPFCPGNENQTPSPILVIDGKDGWLLRVVPNKFAAVDPTACALRGMDGIFLSAEGFGIAEVIIENRSHNNCIATMTQEEVLGIMTSYRSRYSVLSTDPNIDMITIFRNHGARAGTSLEHPHSQIIATPIVPTNIRQRMQQTQYYHDTYGKCAYCVLLDEEVSAGKRIVMESKYFVAHCPYASAMPFQTQITPKRHFSDFKDVSDEELKDLSIVLHTVLGKFHRGLNDPDFNYAIQTAPISDGALHYDHISINITPRLTTAAGFEIGTGIFINIMPPENAAEFLRSV